MKKNFIILLLLTALLLSACQPSVAAPETTGPKVLAAETFIADMAQNVAGDRLKIEALMPPDLDPHAFEPTPQDMAKISESQVLIINGAGFESWLTDLLQNADGEQTLIEASAGLTSREAREGEEAVQSPEEQAAAFCDSLADKTPAAEKQTGADEASAPTLPAAEEAAQTELLSLKLNPQTGNSHAGFVKIDAATAGDFTLAAGQGDLKLTVPDGREIVSEDSLTVNCTGFTQVITAELQPGEYLLNLSGFQTETTPFIAGPAAGHHPHDSDPHFWLDPISVIQYVENIRDGLIAADPAGKEIYTRNAAAYIVRLEQLDQEIQKQFAAISPERRLIVTNHESFGYFADRYGFKIIGTIIPSISSGSSPSAQQLARLVDHIQTTGASAIFLETGSNPQLAEQISQETGIKVVTDLYTHSITPAGGNAPGYIEMMQYNARVISAALQ